MHLPPLVVYGFLECTGSVYASGLQAHGLRAIEGPKAFPRSHPSSFPDMTTLSLTDFLGYQEHEFQKYSTNVKKLSPSNITIEPVAPSQRNSAHTHSDHPQSDIQKLPTQGQQTPITDKKNFAVSHECVNFAQRQEKKKKREQVDPQN